MKKGVIFVVLAMVLISSIAAQSSPLEGVWHNEEERYTFIFRGDRVVTFKDGKKLDAPEVIRGRVEDCYFEYENNTLTISNAVGGGEYKCIISGNLMLIELHEKGKYLTFTKFM